MLCMNRNVGWLIVVTALVAPSCIVVPPPVTAGGGSTSGLEYGVDRPGYDYKNFDLNAADPAQCQSACYAEPQCLSFTYVNPGVQGPNPRCWLKNTVAPAVPSSCCTSGVKVAAPQPVAVAPRSGLEYETNRFGSDYNNFDVPSNDPAVCQDACMRDAPCVAFTLVRPGIQGPNARCWLKNRVPPPNRDACCTSGVK